MQERFESPTPPSLSAKTKTIHSTSSYRFSLYILIILKKSHHQKIFFVSSFIIWAYINQCHRCVTDPKLTCRTFCCRWIDVLCTLLYCKQRGLITKRSMLDFFLAPTKPTNHMDRQARTCNTVWVGSWEMTGRTQTLLWWLEKRGIKPQGADPPPLL